MDDKKEDEISFGYQWFDDIVTKLGPTALTVLLYFYYKPDIKISQISRRLGISRNTVKRHLQSLADAGQVDKESIIPAVTRWSVGDHPGSSSLTNRLTNSNTDRPTNRPISKPDSRPIEKTALDKVKELVLSHPRYKKVPVPTLEKKVREAIEFMLDLLVDVDGVEAYCKWWVENKLGKPFNWGLFTCESMLNEFIKDTDYRPGRRAQAGLTEKMVKRAHEEEALRQLEEMAQALMKKQAGGGKLSDIEKQAVEEYRKRREGT